MENRWHSSVRWRGTCSNSLSTLPEKRQFPESPTLFFFPIKRLSWGWGDDSVTKTLALKEEDLSPDPQHLHGKLGTAANVCNPSAGDAQRSLELANWYMSSRPSERDRQQPTPWWADLKNSICTHSPMLLSLQKGWSPDTWGYVDGPSGHGSEIIQ